MDFKKHLENAWNITLKYLASLILITLVMLAISFVTVGILAPVMMAGYMQAIIRLVRDGREPRIQDLFSQMGLFLPLLAFSIVVFIAMLIGFTMLVLPSLIIALAVTFACLYMLPLMTDKQMGLLDAVRTSWQMAVQENVADHVVVVILFIGLMEIGSSVFFIGTLFTQPFATVFVISIYLERAGTGAGSPAKAPTPPPSPEDQGNL